MSIKGSQTERNLLAAFAGESQARNRYTFYASEAFKSGYRQISAIFAETADQEREHAKRFFKFLEGGGLEIQASYPAGVIDSTYDNLLASADGEKHEWGKLYPDFAEVAQKEGFDAIAAAFTNISMAEKQHEKRYLDLAANIEAGKVFRRSEPVVWRCLNCGYIHEGDSAPDKCPACAHPQAHFELLGENW